MARDEYNWIDDPFDEKKGRDLAQEGMTRAGRVSVALGCLGVAVVLLVAAVLLWQAAAAFVAGSALF